MKYTRKDFEELEYDMITGKPKPLLNVLNKSKISKYDFDELFLNEDTIFCL